MEPAVPSEAVAGFLANTTPLMPDYRSLDVRILAQEGDDGRLYLRGLQAVLLHEAPETVPRVEGPNGDGFWSRQVITNPTYVTDLLAQAETGCLQIGGRDIVFKERDDRIPSLSSFYRARMEGATTPSMGMHIVGIGTDSGKVPSKTRMDRLEAILRSLEPPWDGWQDVSLNFLGFRGGIALESHRPASMAFQVEAPLGLHLETVHLSDGTMEVGLAAEPNVRVEEIRLGMFAGFASHVERSLVPIQPLHSGAPLTVKVPVKPGLRHAVFTASYRGWEAGRVKIRIPGSHVENPRVSQLRHALKVRDVVQDGLLDEAVRGRDLEPWLALLLYELGLQVAPTDKPGNKAGTVDMLAMMPGKDTVLLMEMTEDAPDNRDKMRKLAVRATQLTESIMQDAFPVLVTRLPRSAVPQSDRQTAGREGIALVCREDLSLLAQMADENRASDDLFPFLESRIPPYPENEARGGGRRRGPLAYL